MKRRLIILVIALALLFSAHSAMASYSDERWQYTDAGVQQERCTYRCWHEAYDRLGISLPLTWGNAATWAANARNNGYTVDYIPTANSIVCWSGNTWGHVAYVTAVDSTKVYIREAGINPVNGLYYQDTSYNLSNQNRWSGYTLQGYIHLVSNKIQLWDVAENSTWNGIARFWAKREDNDTNHYAVFYIDDTPVTGNLSADENGYFSVSIDTRLYVKGSHKLSIHYVNSSSDWWSARNVLFDNSAYLYGIEDGQTLTGTIEVKAVRQDGDLNHYAVFYVDDIDYSGHMSADNEGFFSTVLNTLLFENGTHQLKVHYVNSTNDYWDTRNITISNSHSVSASGQCGDDLYWTLYSSGVLHITGTGEMTSHPWYASSVNTLVMHSGATSICDDAFSGGAYIERVFLPDTLQTIGKRAFENNYKLSEITIPGHVTSIGDFAFESCSLLSQVSLPEGLTTIGNSAFFLCESLTRISLPSSVTEIGTIAFNRSGITSMVLPNNISSFGGRYGASSQIDYYADASSLTVKSLGYSGGSFFDLSYPGLQFQYLYEEDYEKGLGIIDADKTIENVIIPANCRIIGGWAFSSCNNIEEIILPDSVVELDYRAFSDCENLRKITMSQQLTKIGLYCFNGCKNLKEIGIPTTVTTIGEGAFCGCASISEIAIPETVTNLSTTLLFNECSKLKTISLPTSCLDIGNFMFAGCAITSFSIPEGVLSIGSNAFSNCSMLGSIQLPNSLQSIGSWSFYSCNALSRVTFPSSLQSIDDRAFSHCSGLNTITLPNGIHYIGEEAFSYCTSLKSIIVDNSICEVSDTEDYSIDFRAFYECTELRDVSFPKGINIIGTYAFDACTSLENIVIPDSINTISAYAFIDCDNLENITIPNYIKIESFAFSTYSLKEIHTLKDDRQKAGEYTVSTVAFSSNQLELVELPAGCQIDPSAFRTMNNDVTVIVPEGFTDFINPVTSTQIVHLYVTRDITIHHVDDQTILYCYRNTSASNWAKNNGITVVYLDDDEDYYPADTAVPISIEEYRTMMLQGNTQIQFFSGSDGNIMVYDLMENRMNYYDVSENLLGFQITHVEDDKTYVSSYSELGYLNSYSVSFVLSNSGTYSEQYDGSFNLLGEAISFYSLGVQYSYSVYNSTYKKSIDGAVYPITKAEFETVKGGGEPDLNAPAKAGLMILPSSTKVIESEAFVGFPVGTRIVLPDDVESIAADAFDSSVIIVCNQNCQTYEICVRMGLSVEIAQ